MKNFNRSLVKTHALKTALLLSVFGSSAALAQTAPEPAPAPAPASAAMTTPAMAGPLSANPNPLGFDLFDLGKVYVGGAVTGLGYLQTNTTKGALGDRASYLDLSNAQITVQKTDGWLQFYVQAGEYSFPTVGTAYTKAGTATTGSFGDVPVAYVKLQGQDNMADWSVQAGKLPTLTGDEYNFTFENMNVERGLLWNIEPAISRGVQVNYSSGPITASVSFNDGYYSDYYNTMSGLLSYVFSPSDTLAFAASGDLGGAHLIKSGPSAGTPGSLLAAGDLFDLIWTHTMGNWTFSPYLQYSTTPYIAGFAHGTTELGEALLASYSVDDNWKVSARFEHESSTGTGLNAQNIIGFGPGSNAFEFTLTPSYQYKLYFVRPEISYISAGSIAAGSGFGSLGKDTDQFRAMLEAGIVF